MRSNDADRKALEDSVFAAARDNGISSVLFRNAVRRKVGLNITDSECLSFLSIKGTATPTDLSRYTGLSTGSTTAMLDRLEKAEFINRTANESDRRGVVISVNKKWSEAAAPLVVGVQKLHKQLIAEYTDSELRTIADFLRRFTKNVTDQIKIIDENLENR